MQARYWWNGLVGGRQGSRKGGETALKNSTRIIGNLALVVLPFGITLGILNYLDSHSGSVSSNPAANQSQTKAADNSLPSSAVLKNIAFTFSVDSRSPNWTRPAYDAAIADTFTDTTKEGLLVRSSAPVLQFELVSTKIGTKPMETYIIQYDIMVTQGAIVVGVLDAAHDKWVMQHAITQHQDSFRFSAPSDATKIVIYNNSSSPSTAMIANLVMGQD